MFRYTYVIINLFKDFLKMNTNSTYQEIPYPLRRTISSEHWNKTITYNFDLDKIRVQLENYNWNSKTL